jgi:hypothetical protein
MIEIIAPEFIEKELLKNFNHINKIISDYKDIGDKAFIKLNIPFESKNQTSKFDLNNIGLLQSNNYREFISDLIKNNNISDAILLSLTLKMLKIFEPYAVGNTNLMNINRKKLTHSYSHDNYQKNIPPLSPRRAISESENHSLPPSTIASINKSIFEACKKELNNLFNNERTYKILEPDNIICENLIKAALKISTILGTENNEKQSEANKEFNDLIERYAKKIINIIYYYIDPAVKIEISNIQNQTENHK